MERTSGCAENTFCQNASSRECRKKDEREQPYSKYVAENLRRIRLV